MSTESRKPANWFEQGGEAYARFRPEYPPELAAFLAGIAPANHLAVDVGCGTGQLTAQLADHFEHVMGLDPSEDQIAHAIPHSKIRYVCSPAESLAVDSGCAGLITAAQAAHWFDLPRFYGEVRRIAVPDAVIALISYGVLRLEGELDARFQRFYGEEIGRFWPAERRLVDSGYADMDFPFEELAGPVLEIRKAWGLGELLGYISTWSAVRGAREAGEEPVLQRFAGEMAEIWGDADRKREVSWPINMRLGATGALEQFPAILRWGAAHPNTSIRPAVTHSPGASTVPGNCTYT